MKFGKKNRFAPGVSRVSVSPGAILWIDVQGLVAYEGERAVRVTIDGRAHDVDAHQIVEINGRRYRLSRVTDRDTLVPLA